MFHIGHLNILRQAREQCDRLIVGVSTDELVITEKGHTPVIPFEERMQIVAACRYVDDVVEQTNKDKLEAWRKLGFNRMFVGSDWQGTEAWKHYEDQFLPLGVGIVYLPHTDGVSSTQLTAFVKHLADMQTSSYVNQIAPPLRKIGYTTGVFDMFHIGHLNIIRRAKERCDYLIVGVSTDDVVRSYKNKTPKVSFEERMAIVASMRYVDEVVPQESMDKLEAWDRLHFDVLFHGDDWKGSSMYDDVQSRLEQKGCETVFLPHTDGISSAIIAAKLAHEGVEA